jgi:hypothetical protein
MSQKALVHTDAFIEHWAGVFTRGKLRATLGITFERFLTAPRRWCAAARLAANEDAETILARWRRDGIQAAAERIEAQEFAPLLPAQQAVAERVHEAETTAALKRMEAGTTTVGDAALIRAALGQSATGRRILAEKTEAVA